MSYLHLFIPVVCLCATFPSLRAQQLKADDKPKQFSTFYI
jgi:hypothetical protein